VKLVLPDAHADFVFAVAGEEFGLIVCLIIVALFAFIVLRSLLRTVGENNLFILLAVTGLVTSFGLQAVVNMASTLHLMPTKGMTLPFISYGGSSIVAIAWVPACCSPSRASASPGAPRYDGAPRHTHRAGAGGTGGHLFPAEALAGALIGRGFAVDLITDERGTGFSKLGNVPVHHIASGGIAGKGLTTRARNYLRLAVGFNQSRKLLKRLRPAVAVGFGGYPSVPPLLAAQMGRINTVIHEQNAVMGRANRALLKRATKVALSFDQVRFTEHLAQSRKTITGNPVRPAIAEIGTRPYRAPDSNGPLNLLVFGGSQGARVFGRVAPAAIALLPETLRRRLKLVQQVRAEGSRRGDGGLSQHRIGCRVETHSSATCPRATMGASRGLPLGRVFRTELAAAGRPALMIPLPNSIDDHQMANADSLASKGGGWVMSESAFTPENAAEHLTSILSGRRRPRARGGSGARRGPDRCCGTAGRPRTGSCLRTGGALMRALPLDIGVIISSASAASA